MAYRQNAQSKMSFSIEELSKSSRVPDPFLTDAVVNHIHEIYLPNSSQTGRADIKLSLTNSAQRTQYKRKLLDDSLHSDDNSFSSTGSTSRDCTADIKLSLTNSAQRTQYKRKLLDDSLHSDDNSFSSTGSTSRDCTSPGSCSDNSDKSDQQAKRARTTYTNSQLDELEQYYSNSKYLQIEDRPVLSKKLKLSQHKIKWWFQNRRMKEKRRIKSTSYNCSPELSQFVGVGKPGSRMITTMESSGYNNQKSYSPFPMFSPYISGMSPFMFPGYGQQFYSSG